MRSILASCALVALVFTAPFAGAQIDPEVTRIVAELDAKVRADTGVRLVVEDTMDVVDEEGRVVQYAHTRQIDLVRPDRLHVVSKGDLADREFIKDGEKVTIVDHREQIYAELASPGTVEDTLTFLIERYGIVVPMGDLFTDSPSQTLLGDARRAERLGEHQVGGVACHHLWISYDDIDAQLWIDVDGGHLRKFLIRYENEPGTPQYTLRVVSRARPDASDERYTAAVPDGYELVDVEPLVEAARDEGR